MKELDAYKEKLSNVMETPKEGLQRAFKKALEKTLEKRDDAAFGELVRISYPYVIASDHDLRVLLTLYETKEALSPIEMCIHSKKYHKKYVEKYAWLSETPCGKDPLHPKPFLTIMSYRKWGWILPEEIGDPVHCETVREAVPYRLKRKDIVYKKPGKDSETAEYTTAKIETFLFYTYCALDRSAAEKRATEMDALMRNETEKRLNALKAAIQQVELGSLRQPFIRAQINYAEENAALCTFGSVARESATQRSDIDLLVIYKTSKETGDKRLAWTSPQEAVANYTELIVQKLKKTGTRAHVSYAGAASEKDCEDILKAETVEHAKAIAWNTKILEEARENMRKSSAYKKLQEIKKHAEQTEKESAEGSAYPEIDVKWNELAEALRRKHMLEEFGMK